MDISDTVIEEIGDQLLKNDLFVRKLAARLIKITSAKALLKEKPSKLKDELQRGHVYGKLVDISEGYALLGDTCLLPLQVELLKTNPVEGDYYPIAPLSKHLSVPVFGSLNAWKGAKQNLSVCAAALSILGLLPSSGQEDHYGFSMYQVERKTCKNIRCIRIPKLPIYQKLFRRGIADLETDIANAECRVGYKHQPNALDHHDYTGFLDNMAELTEDQLLEIAEALD